jgi:hypothetical protein
VRTGNSWDLKSCTQEPGESQWDYIRWFSKQCNSLPNVVNADGLGRAQCSALKNRRLVPLRRIYCAVRLRQPRLTHGHKGEPPVRCVFLVVEAVRCDFSFWQKHSTPRVACSYLNKSRSRSRASDECKDTGSPAGPLPTSILAGPKQFLE